MSVQHEGREQSLAGRWHLFGAELPDSPLPDHRVDLVFYDDDAGLRGAMQARGGSQELPLRSVTFDGTELRLQPATMPNAALLDDPPFLVMRPVAGRFEGSWDMPGAEHIRLKLVRASG
jgi:hypothetical protein